MTALEWGGVALVLAALGITARISYRRGWDRGIWDVAAEHRKTFGGVQDRLDTVIRDPVNLCSRCQRDMVAGEPEFARGPMKTRIHGHGLPVYGCTCDQCERIRKRRDEVADRRATPRTVPGTDIEP